jgi:hypothetical protein
MRQIHFTLMGKGGAGKSLISWLIAQYFASSGHELYCADTDPTNASFSKFKALNVDYIQIADDSMTIDSAKFDALVERLVEHQGVSVIDNGASSFLPFMRYMNENGVLELLMAHGCKVFIHAPLVGGVAMLETMRGLELILTATEAQVVIWENEYYGPATVGGERVSNAPMFVDHRDRIHGIVRIQEREEGTFGADIRETMAQHLTFDEAIKSPNTRLMRRQRLATVQRDIYGQLEGIGL